MTGPMRRILDNIMVERKRRIIAHLPPHSSSRSGMTVAELAELLDLTESKIRTALAPLVREGSVVRVRFRLRFGLVGSRYKLGLRAARLVKEPEL
jgi:DNA-binding IclR family transcriptional regulator